MDKVELTRITGETEQQQNNIVVSYDTLDKDTLACAMSQLRELTECVNFKMSYDVSTFWGYHDIIRLGRWNIYCYTEGLQLSEAFFHTIALPLIPYTNIKSIEFDTYLDRSHLVGIWITLNNDTMYRVSTVAD